jgi:hypothetical protein
MSHSKEINETSIRQLQITHIELKLYSDACSEPTARYFALRFPRVRKIHGDRSFKDATSFEEPQTMAKKCSKVAEDGEREETY